MIYVILSGHDYTYDTFELLRSFFNREDIKIADKKNSVKFSDVLIKSKLTHIVEGNRYIIDTTIYKEDKALISHTINSLSTIDTVKNNINSKIKVGVKQGLYNVVSKFLNKQLPWGILTGIRPTKIVHELMDKKYSIKTIHSMLINSYKISNKKANLLIKVANRERKFVYPVDDKKYSLYVSIPFCPTRCVYCSFPSNSLASHGKYLNTYIEKLVYEIKKVGQILSDKIIETVYIGGGTPTSIPIENLKYVIHEIYKYYGDNIREFTVEAGRPDTLNIDMLNMLKKNKIDRISINPQTMCDNTLKLIGRNHSANDIISTYNMARKIGFKTINMDLIIGLPNEGLKELEYTLQEIEKINPDNLTIHTLAIKKASRLKKSMNKYVFADDDTIKAMLELTKKYIKKMDMYPYYMYRQKQTLANYENVGYCKHDKESIYNILMMEERQTIIAVGAGGISKIYTPKTNGVQRVPNVKGLVEYINRTDEMIKRKSMILNKKEV